MKYKGSTSNIESVKVVSTPTPIAASLTIAAPGSANTRQQFPITSKLTAKGVAIPKQIISLQRLNGSTWTTIATTNTTNNVGAYVFTRAETTIGTYHYRTLYTGSTTYSTATSPIATVTIKR